MDLDEQANRLRALWKSGRDKYASFFTILEEVRQEVGNDALQAWCFQFLRISLSVIVETRKVLTKVDADIVKRNTAAAVAAEKAEMRNAREAKRKQREDEAHTRELERERRAQELAEEKLVTEQKKTAVDQAKTKRKTSTKRRKHMAAEFIEELASANLNDLSERFKNAEAHCLHGINEWIEGSIAKAVILATARELLVADQDFGAWCDALVNLSHQDRAALVGLGRLGESKLRELFNATDSRSYELIWRRHKPELKVLER
jgi:flagellar biosynthesis GTPase FlhF